MEPKDCLPFPQRPAFDSVTTAYTLADPSKTWLLNPLQANVEYYGDAVTILVRELNPFTSLGNPAFQHDRATSYLGVPFVRFPHETVGGSDWLV